ncbi:hypothetical protein FCN77_10320 [Arthrobacter sp. 24S4-2]|uniref:hypothetical protein n=1 Tax=Arthrobacter sp. 24S4-2 TaxID=2575374 RepID=UPI0010C7CBE1|nr:hypothetical protein [Arthrobacter sp. 24S4-2]QCO98034.1 hypothetical protein FCN77_10320 [Arthrobacter sp. 24S4-2]
MTPQIRGAQNWTRLAECDLVDVHEGTVRRFSAVVDIKPADSIVVWVVDSYGFRSAFDHREEVELPVLDGAHSGQHSR